MKIIKVERQDLITGERRELKGEELRQWLNENGYKDAKVKEQEKNSEEEEE